MARKKRRRTPAEPDFGGPDFDDDAIFEDDFDPDPPCPPSRQMMDLGEPPEDPEKAMQWMFRAQTIALREAMVDPKLSARGRRREMRTIAAAASRLYPDSARARVADRIQKDRDELAAKRRNRAAAALEQRPKLGTSAGVIPFRHAAAPKIS